ncbi:MAG: hypothetical protein JW384_03853 [Nitrosomonadaceae bacterium]|nr:hypothetical protein [Nitrosomonadaceae bacterium]
MYQPSSSTPSTPTITPTVIPDTDPDRRLNPARICPDQQDKVVREIEKYI